MDIKQEPSDGECEQTTSGVTPPTKTVKTEHSDCSIFVLTPMEESERVGRACHALKYQPKLVHGSNAMGLKVEKVVLSTDLIIKYTEELYDKKHPCEICGAEHGCITELELHMQDHRTSGKDYRIGVTENKKKRDHESEAQTSSGQTGLNLANRKKKFSQGEKHMCKFCGGEYAHKTNLFRHMRIHTGETPFTCKICAKSFRRSDWLAKHMNMHKDKSQPSPERKKPYACDHCEKMYQSRESLQRHVRTHTGERPYHCAICDKRFYNEGCLNVHLRVHSDGRPYTCSECGRSFKRSGTLNKHKRIHTGEKPYSCNICGKRFRYKYSETLHMKICCRQRS